MPSTAHAKLFAGMFGPPKQHKQNKYLYTHINLETGPIK